MLTISQDSRQCILSWGEWQLEFEWRIDRWAHSLSQVQSDVRDVVWRSVEGMPDEVWPGSPAFQDLYTERINENCGEVQLLGQAGKNHYSGAIRCDGTSNTIDFDLAVRIQTLPQAPLSLSSYSQVAIPGQNSESTWQFLPELIEGFPVLTEKLIPASRLRETHFRLQMEELHSLTWDRHRTTIRWKYRCRLVPVA